MNDHPALEAAARFGVRLGLDRMRAFLATLADPQLRSPVVHIGGTNGKGSTTTLVTAALVDAGYRVGTTISPHLQQINERIQIDGAPLADDVLDGLLCDVDAARRRWAESVGAPDAPLTYFELATASAFVAFARAHVGVSVVEVGLGGRLDATNVVEPSACAIVTVGMDHEAELGSTFGAIAGEKAGILKPGVPGVLGPMPEEAQRAIEAVATSVGAPLWVPGRHLRRAARSDGAWDLATPAGQLSGVRLRLAGAHQGGNALVALGLLHHMRAAGLSIPDDAILSGFARAFIGGRVEELAPGLVVDGAHNAEGAAALAAWLARRERPRRRLLLWGMGEDREPEAILPVLLPHVDAVITTHGRHPKARPSGELAARIAPWVPGVRDGGPIEVALAAARADADEVIVSGSLYLVGAVRDLVGR